MKKTNEWAAKIAVPAAISIMLLSFLLGGFSVAVSPPASETTRLIDEIGSLNIKIAELEEKYGALIENLQVFNMQADEARALHWQTEKELKSKRKILNRRLVDMYKCGKTSWVTIVFDSRDLLDFIDRAVWTERIADDDARMMREVRVTEATAGEQEQAIVENRRALKSRCDWAVTQKNKLEEKLAGCMRKLASIDPILGKLMEQPQTELSSKINLYLAGRRSPLTGYGIVFVQAEQRTGVGARLLVGLTAAESSCATAGTWSKTNHNAWGMKGPQPRIAGGIPARGGYCTWPNWEIAIQQAADFVRHYWGPAQTAMQLPGYCETGGPGSNWAKRVEGSRSGI